MMKTYYNESTYCVLLLLLLLLVEEVVVVVAYKVSVIGELSLILCQVYKRGDSPVVLTEILQNEH